MFSSPQKSPRFLSGSNASLVGNASSTLKSGGVVVGAAASEDENFDFLAARLNVLNQEYSYLLKEIETKAAEKIRHANEEAKLILEQAHAAKHKEAAAQDSEKRFVTVASTITLNVGGQIFTTATSTFAKCKKRSMLRNIIDNPPEYDEDGRIFIDRDGHVFRHIVNFLRNETKFLCLPDDPVLLSEIRNEAEYYELPDLVDILTAKIEAQQHQQQQQQQFVAPTSPWTPTSRAEAAMSDGGASEETIKNILRMQIDQQQKELDRKDAKILQLQEEISNFSYEIQTLRDELRSKEESLVTSSFSIKYLEEERERLQNELQASQNLVRELQRHHVLQRQSSAFVAAATAESYDHNSDSLLWEADHQQQQQQQFGQQEHRRSGSFDSPALSNHNKHINREIYDLDESIGSSSNSNNNNNNTNEDTNSRKSLFSDVSLDEIEDELAAAKEKQQQRQQRKNLFDDDILASLSKSLNLTKKSTNVQANNNKGKIDDLFTIIEPPRTSRNRASSRATAEDDLGGITRDSNNNNNNGTTTTTTFSNHYGAEAVSEEVPSSSRIAVEAEASLSAAAASENSNNNNNNNSSSNLAAQAEVEVDLNNSVTEFGQSAVVAAVAEQAKPEDYIISRASLFDGLDSSLLPSPAAAVTTTTTSNFDTTTSGSNNTTNSDIKASSNKDDVEQYDFQPKKPKDPTAAMLFSERPNNSKGISTTKAASKSSSSSNHHDGDDTKKSAAVAAAAAAAAAIMDDDPFAAPQSRKKKPKEAKFKSEKQKVNDELFKTYKLHNSLLK